MTEVDRMKEAWRTWFGGSTQGYFVTVDSKRYVRDAFDPRIPDAFIVFRPKLDALADRLNTYCFGRRYKRGLPEARLKILAALEVGEKKALVHAHLICVHDGTCRRSVFEIEEKVARAWKKIANFSCSGSAWDVQPINILSSRLDYAMKQTGHFLAVFKENNLMPL